MKKNLLSLIWILIMSMILCSCSDRPRKVLIETEFGDMEIELFDSTPQHRDNFIKLAKEGYYDGLLFHRIIRSFMAQGGDPNSKNAGPGTILGSGGPAQRIPAEIGAPHFKGALAAARDGNPEKASSGSQFYIVQGSPQTENTLASFERHKKIKYNPDQIKKYLSVGGTPELDMEYTVFGQVVKGIDIIDKLCGVPTGQYDRPMKDVKMKVRILH